MERREMIKVGTKVKILRGTPGTGAQRHEGDIGVVKKWFRSKGAPKNDHFSVKFENDKLIWFYPETDVEVVND
jgi:hypothetical protein